MGDKALIFFLGAYLEQTTGKKMCNDNGELIVTKDDIIYMLKFYKKLIDEKALMPLDRSDLNSFVKEESGAVMRWTSGAEIFFQDVIDKGINIEIAPYPMAEGAKTLGWYIKPATLYAISSTTEHPKEAAKLLDFLVNSREMTLLQKTDKGIPISKSAENVLEEEGLIPDLDYRANKQMLDNQEKMPVMYPVLENENVYVSFKSEADYYLYNRSTVEEVAEKIYNDFYSN
jgi:oligogalacturonide transport system substrate-binding protein